MVDTINTVYKRWKLRDTSGPFVSYSIHAMVFMNSTYCVVADAQSHKFAVGRSRFSTILLEYYLNRNRDWGTAVYTHPPGAVFQSRLLDNQEAATSANTERCVFGNLNEIGELFLTPIVLAPTLQYSNCREVWKIGPGRCGKHRRTRTVPNPFSTKYPTPTPRSLCDTRKACAIARVYVQLARPRE